MRMKRLLAIMLCVITAVVSLIWIRSRNLRLEQQVQEKIQERDEMSSQEGQLTDIVSGFGIESRGDDLQSTDDEGSHWNPNTAHKKQGTARSPSKYGSPTIR